MKMVKMSIFRGIHGALNVQQLPLLYKGTKQAYGIPKQRKEARRKANFPENVSFKYQKAHKMSAVSKWVNATSRPCTVSGVFLSHQIAICYCHLTVYVSPVNLSVA